jgi:SnoaL-like domain
MSKQTIERFYKAFASLDSKTMAECYAQDAQFEDEVFQLRGRTHIGGMWAMLCAAIKKQGRADWKLEVRDITDHSAHWEPTYRFSRTGNMVHNIIDAEFEFDSQGLIKRHRDRFDFWRWSRQAMGLSGVLLGWTGWMRNKVKRAATRSLAKHLETSAGRYTT